MPWGFGRGEAEIFVKLSIDSSCSESFKSLGLAQSPKIFKDITNYSRIFH